MTHAGLTKSMIASVYDSLLSGNRKNKLYFNFSNPHSSLPAVYIRENNIDYLIDIAAPGLDKDDFKVNYDHGCLTISSDYEEEDKYCEEEHSRLLFSFQSFHRTFNVPAETIDSDHIEAKYNNDVLHIILPKMERANLKPAKDIRIT